MKCPKCDIHIQHPANADVYFCRSCKMAFAGIDIRNLRCHNSMTKPFKIARALYKIVLEKIESGEYV